MRGKCNVGIKINMRRNAMFNFLKKMRNKDNTPKKGYDLSYDNLAIPEIHIKGNADAKPGGSDNKINGQQAEGAMAQVMSMHRMSEQAMKIWQQIMLTTTHICIRRHMLLMTELQFQRYILKKMIKKGVVN